MYGSSSQNTARESVDLLITGGIIVDGSGNSPSPASIAVTGDQIVYVGENRSIRAKNVLNARGLIVSPGFIDPHTHADQDLSSPETSINEAYLRQGVTTVFIGNDGGGSVTKQLEDLELGSLGTNVGLLAGHGAIRAAVVGYEDRPPTAAELARMQLLLAEDMQAGALGLSTGLFYAPGNFAGTDEVVALAQVAAEFGGIYESHIRDESNYSIGLLASISEVIEISERGGIPAHIAHIKALGPAVHGQSKQIVELINEALQQGLMISADQYPWLASGTRLSNALIPRSVMDGGVKAMEARLHDAAFVSDIRAQMQANLVRRGGADALLITGDSPYRGKTLQKLADEQEMDPLTMAIEIVLLGDPAIASFMMNPDDINRLIVQPWVVTGSDGTIGHPRKYGTFPKKYQEYVIEQSILSISDFVRQSSTRTAEIFGLCDRGKLVPGYKADIAIWDPDDYQSIASYEQPEKYASGIVHVMVNGGWVIKDRQLTGHRGGSFVNRLGCSE